MTGGAGFLGSALVERFLAEGYHVEVVDDLSTGSLTNLAGAREQARSEGSGALKIHQADVLDASVTELVARHEPEVVVHLAGASAKADRGVGRQATLDVAGTVRVLEGARRAGARKIVCVASAKAQLDDVRCIPGRAVHEYLEAYRDRYGLAHTTLVLPTVYGPRQTPSTESSVVAVFVERVLSGQPCVLHGDGTQQRDLLYVDDAVDAFVRALTHGDGAVLEIGTGVLTAVRDLQTAVMEAAGTRVEVVGGSPRDGEPGAVSVDPRRAATQLGWEAWTPLATGLGQTISAARRT